MIFSHKITKTYFIINEFFKEFDMLIRDLLYRLHPAAQLSHRREKQHKTFKDIAEKGQYSIGWFCGFNLHLIINDKWELLDFILSPGNVDDRKSFKNMDLHKRIFGKLLISN